MLDNPTLLLIAGVLILILTLVRVMRRRGSALASGPARSAPAPKTLRPEQARPIVDDVEVRIYNTFRELNARLELKTHLLNELILEADRKAARLERLVEPGEPVIVGIDAAREGEASESSNRFAEIYALADRGMTPAEISQRVDQPIGEIQLILSLERRRKSG